MTTGPHPHDRIDALLSADRSGSRGPEPLKRIRIVDWVRTGIAEGRFLRGAPLPDRPWFEAKFRATHATVQRAFNQLAEEGFTVAVRRRGTFVAERPPFTGRYLLALSGTREHPADDMIGRTLREAARRVSAHRGIAFEIRNLLDEGPDSKDYDDVLADLVRQRWAGVFLRALSSNRGLRTIANVDHVPIAGLYTSDPRALGSLSLALAPEHVSGFLSACRRLFAACVDAGCRSVLVLSTAIGNDEEAAVRNLARTMGLRIGKNGYQTAWIDEGGLLQARRLLRLALSSNTDLLPDAIVLLDDNFVTVLEAALSDCFGAKQAPSFFIAACGNLPVLPQTSLRVSFCGLDMERTLDSFVAWAEAVHNGDPNSAKPRLVAF